MKNIFQNFNFTNLQKLTKFCSLKVNYYTVLYMYMYMYMYM